jgi:hypothetical protein
MYQEAIRAFWDQSNSERLAICCDLLREIIDEIPRATINKRIEGRSAGPLVDWIETQGNARANDPRRMKRDGRSWRYLPWWPLATFLSMRPSDAACGCRSVCTASRQARPGLRQIAGPSLLSPPVVDGWERKSDNLTRN